MTGPRGSLSVENVVASCKINQELALDVLAQDLEGVRYDPDHFPGVILQIEEPKASSFIYRSGSIVCTGAKSIPAVEAAMAITVNALEDIGVDVPVDTDPTIQNIVSSGDLGQELDLSATAIGLGLELTEYEPEQFPGLVYRPADLDTTILLFGSGRVVIAGATDLEDAKQTIEQVGSQLSDLNLIEWNDFYCEPDE